ncbi:slipin family protein [Sphaerimonospora mesophila]|uniref:slipin family protein n=1 Tax=Sphaerimonospora mesophila TaxID=37483 RepID=UPI0009FB2EED
MESVLSALIVVLGVLLLIAVARGVRVVQQFETGIVFRLGRIQPNVRGPGLHLIVPIVDRMQKVNMQIVAMGVPAQDGITRDNVSVRVDAVVYFRVIDPIKAVVNVQNYLFAVSQVAQTSLRSVIGQSELDHLLSDRDALNARLRAVIDEPTEGPWGIRIERVEIKDVALPDGMKRSMSRQAEAERERRARIITADGEFQASKRLAAAARQMSSDPAALQLRMLQTVVEVAAEKNSTLVMPLPVEMLRFFDRMAPAAAVAASSADESGSAVPEGSAEPEPEPLEEAIRELPSVESPDVPLAGPRIEPPAWHHRTADGEGV